MSASAPLSTDLSHVLVAYTIELDNEFERRFAGQNARIASLVMWSNFLRFVGDGITVGELPGAARLPKARMLSTLGGMERWRYVFVAPEPATKPQETKRDGYGSGRGLRNESIIRPTPAGRKAEEIWRPLFGEIERRWEERFGPELIEELRTSLRAIAELLDVELPQYVPIVASSDGMRAGVSPAEREDAAGDSVAGLHLVALLSQALLAYTLDFEGESELSLALGANFVRVLDETGVGLRDVPRLAAVSKEATAMALTFLAKTGYVVVEGGSAATKVARLTPRGRRAQEGSAVLHAAVEKRWKTRFGTDAVDRLRSSLNKVLEQRDGLSRGLEPHSGGWRASRPYVESTKAMIADPRAGLPDYPLVLHRGGWPDGR